MAEGKTKFILIGGLPSRALDEGKALLEEMTQGISEPVKILDVMFARPHERWVESFASDQDWVARVLTGKPVQWQLAEPETFAEQVIWADVIYLKGGDEKPLLQALKRDSAWMRHLFGKVVAGSSAGAYALAKYYHALNTYRLGEGLGLVPVKTLSHWQSKLYSVDWDKVRRELEEYGDPKMPTLIQREGEFQVFNVVTPHF
jgi:Peptidase family S51